MFDLTGHTALVTGGGSGIGKHFAQVLARHGAAVVVAGRRVDKLEAAADSIRAHRRKGFVVEMDVSHESSVAGAIEKAQQMSGTIDILINNAGIVGTQPALDMPE